MSVRVLFFASLRDATGTEEIEIDLQEKISLEGLIQKLTTRLTDEAVQALSAENVRVAINQTLASGSVQIESGDEVAFLPPVTGG